jgi:hypothetical protein
MAADVSFRKAFEDAKDLPLIVVSVPDSDLLVIEPGDYFTVGRRLVLRARQVRVDGKVHIAFFEPGKRADNTDGTGPVGPDQGQAAHYVCNNRSGCGGAIGGQGKPGAVGKQGAPASSMFIAVQELTQVPGGTLHFTMAGQQGGKGQTGGTGGRGGRGGDGASRECGVAPGDGGAGGPRGPGGLGGQGGPGGAGGKIVLSRSLARHLGSPSLIVSLERADGGPGGDPGNQGEPGGGGGMGGGGCGGGGGTNGVTLGGSPAPDEKRRGEKGIPGSPAERFVAAEP